MKTEPPDDSNSADRTRAESNPSESVCANCTVPLSVQGYVTAYKLTQSGRHRTVHQVLQLVLNGLEVSEPCVNSQRLKLCSTCGAIFGKVLSFYIKFLQATSPGSYVHNLRSNINVKSIQGDQHDRDCDTDVDTSSLERDGLSITIRDSPFLSDDPPLAPSVTVSLGRGMRSKRRRETVSTSPGTKKRKVLVRRQSFRRASAVEDKPLRRIRSSAKLRQFRSKFRTYGKNAADKKDDAATEQDNADGAISDPDECGNSDDEDQLEKSKDKVTVNGSRPPPSPEYSDELKALLVTTQYKCDSPACAVAAVTFDTLLEWAVHQEVVHGFKTGYKDLETAAALEPKYFCYRPCSQCGKKFKTTRNLILHLNGVHLRLRPFPCDICGKTFVTKVNVQVHKDLTHSEGGGLRNFLCTLCGNTFKTKGNLEMHEKTHLGLLEEHECPICHFKFATGGGLRNHMGSVHSEDRPHACDQCHKTFKIKNQLRSHFKRVHAEKVLNAICEFCGRAYSNKQHLLEHLMSVHKLDRDRARDCAGIKRGRVFRVMPNGDRVVSEKPKKPPTTCSLCSRTYVRRGQLHAHLMSVHGRTELEATVMTGFRIKY